MKISAVSGTYNRLVHLQRMVESVRHSVGNMKYEIVIVDGGSTDGSIEWCKSQSDIVLIEQGELLGAIKAFNAGAYLAQGEYVALLNDDILVLDNTLEKSVRYLESRPEVGQVAFINDVKGSADAHRVPLARAFGYLYGQCSITPKVLGDIAGWWGDEGMRTYGGDTRLSLRLAEMGYPTVSVPGCKIRDLVVEDELRTINNADQRAKGPGNSHPDTIRFHEVWNGRLPRPGTILPPPINNVLAKASRGTLRTLRFKAMMRPTDPQRTAMINAFSRFGPSYQVANVTGSNERYQSVVLAEIEKFKPDLVLFQSQRPGRGVSPETVKEVRRRHPNTYLVNWDGDMHVNLLPWHFEIARTVDLQVVVSPSLFPKYHKNGAFPCYWPISVEQEYLDINTRGPFLHNVTFMGSLYGEASFPEAITRRESVSLLHSTFEKVAVFGFGWAKAGIKTTNTVEEHSRNAKIYAQSRLGLSTSHVKDAWGYSSDRLYNIAATGCPTLVQRFNGVEEHGFIDGETCIMWDEVSELVEKVRYYLQHEDEREAIGRRCKSMMHKRHTWERRIDGLFSMIGGMTHG